MKILRVNMQQMKITCEDLPEEWKLIGGRGLIAKIMNQEVPSDVDPLGADNKLIIAGGPLAGTLAPQLGRISVGAKSPLTFGIKEANAGGSAAQKLDRLGIRALVIENAPEDGHIYCLEISKDETRLVLADEYAGMKNYTLVETLYKQYNRKSAIICVGIGGERKYKGASISFTDILGDPSRNAGRGGLGAVMGGKGLKAIIIDDAGAPNVEIENKDLFKKTVRNLTDTVKRDLSCGLFSTFGTPLAVAPNSCLGTMPAVNYGSGRPEGFREISGEVIKRNVWERGGKYHGCMPGCVVKCSIIYNDAQGKRLASAYEYEAIAMLGTNLGIDDPDAVGRLKFLCDDLGLDLIELGSSLGVAASAGRMKMGDVEAAIKLLKEIEEETDFGRVLGNGVVSTAKALDVKRIPAIKGQAIPGHDPRAVKGTGVTYVTNPMGPDHTAGLTYRMPLQKAGQIKNSLGAQIKAAVCDTMGYCINSLPGGRTSIYSFFRDFLNARYGMQLTNDDIVELGKQTLKDELKFNSNAEFGKTRESLPDFIRKEMLSPTKTVFDVEDSELTAIWQGLENYREPQKIWEIRFPSFPQILFGVGVLQKLDGYTEKLGVKNVLLVADPMMENLGYTNEVQGILKKSGIASALFSGVKSDPPVEEIEEIAQIYKEEDCDGFFALGGGSSMDAAKAAALRVSHPGILEEYESIMGGTAKIKPDLPPVVCIPTTSGTGSEVNSYAMITDKKKNRKFIIMSNFLVPKLAVIDPNLTRTMPAGLTAQTGIDAMAHCVEGYVGMAIPYHPYYEALGLYGIKLIGRSLRKAFTHGEDIDARTDMCMAAIYGGICFSKGLGVGHAIGHILGGLYHIPHGEAVSVALLCFVRANQKESKTQFSDLAWALDHSNDLESSLIRLYKNLDMPTRFRDLAIKESDLKRIAFEASLDVPNMVGNPVPLKEGQILKLLKEFY